MSDYPTDLRCKNCGRPTRGMPASEKDGTPLRGVPEDWKAHDVHDRIACCGRVECIDVYLEAEEAELVRLVHASQIAEDP